MSQIEAGEQNVLERLERLIQPYGSFNRVPENLLDALVEAYRQRDLLALSALDTSPKASQISAVP